MSVFRIQIQLFLIRYCFVKYRI